MLVVLVACHCGAKSSGASSTWDIRETPASLPSLHGRKLHEESIATRSSSGHRRQRRPEVRRKLENDKAKRKAGESDDPTSEP